MTREEFWQAVYLKAMEGDITWPEAPAKAATNAVKQYDKFVNARLNPVPNEEDA